jgi:uncharacterized protein
MRQAGEPTVEEILESIKKVIARDNRAGAAIERQRREVEGVREARKADSDDEREPADLVSDEDVLDLSAMARFEDDEPGFEDGAEQSETSEAADFDHLVTADAQESMRESLAALAMLAKPGAPPQIVRSGETSLEGLVREMLRPALAEWLDKNLPPLVEKLVAAEIARIVGKKS